MHFNENNGTNSIALRHKNVILPMGTSSINKKNMWLFHSFRNVHHINKCHNEFNCPTKEKYKRSSFFIHITKSDIAGLSSVIYRKQMVKD